MTDNEFHDSDRLKRREQDYADQQNELADREVGRMARFTSPENRRDAYGERKSDKKFPETLTALQRLLQTPGYAEARAEFGDFLRDVESATDTAIAMVQRELANAEAALTDTLEVANRLPDGRAVFRDKHGQVWTENGELVSADDAAAVVWKDGAPTYEDYQTARQRAENARRKLDELEGYQRDVLGPARDRFEDDEEPMTADEFDEHRKRIKDEMPEAVQDLMPKATVAAPADEIPTAKPKI